jgi:hypothetical protein
VNPQSLQPITDAYISPPEPGVKLSADVRVALLVFLYGLTRGSPRVEYGLHPRYLS